MTRILLIGAAVALMALGFSVASLASKPPSPPGQDPCSHGNTGKPCRPDPQPDNGKDCEHHGKNGGVNEDHCAGTTETTTTGTTETTTTQETTTSTTPTTSQTTTSTIPTTTNVGTQPRTTSESTTTSGSTPAAPKPRVVKIPGGTAAPGYVPKIIRPKHGKPHAIIRGLG